MARPERRPDLPLPPARCRCAGRPDRKRWRYVGVFAEELMLCAARAEVGPLTPVLLGALGSRASGGSDAHTTLRPGSREVRMDGAAWRSTRRGLRASLRLGECAPIEVDLPQRQRLGLDPQARRRPDRGHGRGPRPALGGRRPRRRRRVGRLPPAPHQLALVGRGRRAPPTAAPLAWNLVEGVNDPAAEQRAGDLGRRRAHEPPPGPLRRHRRRSTSPTATRLDFSRRVRPTPATRTTSSSAPATATASAPSPAPSAASSSPTGLGVMEEHDAVW